jgi:hypothetical protein
LFKELMRLKDRSLEQTKEGASLVIAGDIVKISKRILELPTTTEQRRFALGSFAESMLMMRLINVNSELADDSIDSQFLNITEKFLDDPDPRISSYAAVTIIAADIFDFQKNPTAENLKRLEATIDNNLDHLAKLPLQVDRIRELLIRSDLPVSKGGDANDFLDRFANQLKDHPNQQIRDIGNKFEESLAFRRVEIENLVFKIGDRSVQSDQQVDRFFQLLEEYPDASIPTFQVGLDLIYEYTVQGKKKRAADLVRWLDSAILPKRQEVDSKKRIQRALNELKVYTR